MSLFSKLRSKKDVEKPKSTSKGKEPARDGSSPTSPRPQRPSAKRLSTGPPRSTLYREIEQRNMMRDAAAKSRLSQSDGSLYLSTYAHSRGLAPSRYAGSVRSARFYADSVQSAPVTRAPSVKFADEPRVHTFESRENDILYRPMHRQMQAHGHSPLRSPGRSDGLPSCAWLMVSAITPVKGDSDPGSDSSGKCIL